MNLPAAAFPPRTATGAVALIVGQEASSARWCRLLCQRLRRYGTVLPWSLVDRVASQARGAVAIRVAERDRRYSLPPRLERLVAHLGGPARILGPVAVRGKSRIWIATRMPRRTPF